VPTAAFLRARPDDAFWAARRVMAFSDEMIHAIAATGRYTDESAPKLLADVLIQRRDKIGRAYLAALNPVVDVALDADGVLTFENAAVEARVAEDPSAYVVTWASFDNTTGESAPIGSPVESVERRVPAPAALPSAAGAFVKVQIAETRIRQPATDPVAVYFRRHAGGWALVGVDRLPRT
jgi:hypothetical protein